MSIKNFTEFNLPKNAYTAFEADSLKDLIINRLNENSVFTDQNYEGSNINAFIDIVAYMYHVLLFYLNTTSSESNFTTVSLYENINKLVSILNYKPLGKQTSLTTLSLSATPLVAPGAYTLKRFSFINANNIKYNTLKDISFEKVTGEAEQLYIDNNVLVQGTLIESPSFIAQGENFEVITVVDTSLTDKSFVADNSFCVFVKSIEDGVWYEWLETSSLYLEQSDTKKYEKRLNENGNYEFKFGNNVTSKALKANDIVKVIYVLSDGMLGEIGVGKLNPYRFNLYNSSIFNEISNDIYDQQTNFVPVSALPYILPANKNNSSPVSDAETVDQIKENLPKTFISQNRLVTNSDYQSFVERNYNGIIKSISVFSNDDYTTRYLLYFYKIGLNKPNSDCRVMFNQILFSSSTSFNNVYLFSVPKIATILNGVTPNYLNPSQKQLIVNECNTRKDITHNVVFMDPIYKAFNFGLQVSGEMEAVCLKDNTSLVIKRDINVKISSSALKNKVLDIITAYFNNIKLGDIVNLNNITNDILNITGVKRLLTRRTDTNYEIDGISYVVWNPFYEKDDIVFTSQNYSLEKFMYAYFYDLAGLTTKIIIENE
jgi:hypothetical protein